MTSAATTSTRISENSRPSGSPFEVVGRLVPAEVRVEHQRQEQVVAVVDDDQLAAGTLQRGVVDQVFLGAVRADVALQRELARDDFLDRDLLVPAVAAVASPRRAAPDTSLAPHSAHRDLTTDLRGMIPNCSAWADPSEPRQTSDFTSDFRAPGGVHPRDVLLDHPPRRESRRDRPDRFLDDRHPAVRHARAVAIVERRHDFFFEQAVQRRRRPRRRPRPAGPPARRRR